MAARARHRRRTSDPTMTHRCGLPPPAQPARPRLVRVLCRRRANRFRALCLGLPDHAEMDADRYRPGPFRVRFRFADRANAGRRAGRCGALRTAGRRNGGWGDLPECVRVCGAADFPGSAVGVGRAFAGKLRARAGHRGDQSRAWSVTRRSASGWAATPGLPRSAPGLQPR